MLHQQQRWICLVFFQLAGGLILFGAPKAAYSQDSLEAHRQAMHTFDNALGMAADEKAVGPTPGQGPSKEAIKRDEEDARQAMESQRQQIKPPEQIEKEKNAEKEKTGLDKFVEALPWTIASAVGGLIGFLLVKVVTVAVEGGPLLTYGLILGGLVLALTIFLLIYFLVIKKKKEEEPPPEKEPRQPAEGATPAP